MTSRRGLLAVGLIALGFHSYWVDARPDPAEVRAQAQATPPAQQGQRSAGPAQAAPRGRSITLGDVTGFDVKENIHTIAAGQDAARVIFYRDDIFRIWLGPDGSFTEPELMSGVGTGGMPVASVVVHMY